MDISLREAFWNQNRFAVVGHSKRMNFPRLTYQGLKKQNKTVFPIDPSATSIEGDQTFPDFTSLPQPVEAVVIEVPSDESALWVERAAAAGIARIWIHEDCESPEAVELGRKLGLEVLTGTCAVMYLMPKTFPHVIHRWIARWLKRY